MLKLLNVLPTAIAVAKIIQAEMPEDTPGEVKLEKAIETMVTLDEALKESKGPLAALFAIIVRTLKVLGIFKSKADVPA